MAKKLKRGGSNSLLFWLQVISQSGSAARPTRHKKPLITFSNCSINAVEKILSQLTSARLVKTFAAFNGTPKLYIVLKRTCIVT